MRFEQRSCDKCGRTSGQARRGSTDAHDRQHYRHVFEGWQVVDEDGRIKDLCPVCVWAKDELGEGTVFDVAPMEEER